MDPVDEAFLRKLIDETKALPLAEMPSDLELAVGHPGILMNEIKSPQQYDQDMRRKYFLDKASGYYENAAAAPAEIIQQIQKYRRGEMEDLGTPYENQGFWQGRMPTSKGFQWWASLPAVAYNAAKLSANAITPNMYPEAGKDLAKAANTFAFGFPEDLGALPRGTGTIMDDFNREKDERGLVPWVALDTDEAFQDLADRRQDAIDQAIPSGSQYLESVGVDGPVKYVWGGLMDSFLDPFTNTAGTLKAARAGKPALGMLLGDYAVGVGVPAAATVYGQADRLIERLRGGD